MPLQNEIESILNSDAWKEECDACEAEYQVERKESERAVAELEAYQKGYTRGKNEGHDAGFQDGRDFGFREGLKLGLKDGLLEGLKDGIKEGKKIGRNEFRLQMIQNLRQAGRSEDEIKAWLPDE